MLALMLCVTYIGKAGTVHPQLVQYCSNFLRYSKFFSVHLAWEHLSPMSTNLQKDGAPASPSTTFHKQL